LPLLGGGGDGGGVFETLSAQQPKVIEL